MARSQPQSQLVAMLWFMHIRILWAGRNLRRCTRATEHKSGLAGSQEQAARGGGGGGGGD